jgi:hypothetical protein
LPDFLPSPTGAATALTTQNPWRGILVPSCLTAPAELEWRPEMAWIVAVLLTLFITAGGARAEAPANDYPTVVRADYVFGCMQVNGQTRDALERCSCSIDVIASLLPFAQYEEAETVMRVRQRPGEKGALFLTTPLRTKVDELRRAQVEAELRCF